MKHSLETGKHSPLMSRRRVSSLLLAVLAAGMLFRTPLLRAQDSKIPGVLEGVGIEQRLNQQVPLDLPFHDETGKTVRLGDYFGQKPVILSFAYFNCPMLCTMVMNGIMHSLRDISFNMGQQYEVLTVSIDPQDKPEIAASKQRVYTGLYSRPGAESGWHFLTGDESSIRQLTQAAGFHYKFDPHTGQFNHATGIMVLTPQGQISKYFYGIDYIPRALRLALVEASHGRIGTPVDQLLLFCCEYDPKTGKYGMVIARVLQLCGFVTVFGLGTLMFILLRRERRLVAAHSTDRH